MINNELQTSIVTARLRENPAKLRQVSTTGIVRLPSLCTINCQRRLPQCTPGTYMYRPNMKTPTKSQLYADWLASLMSTLQLRCIAKLLIVILTLLENY